MVFQALVLAASTSLNFVIAGSPAPAAGASRPGSGSTRQRLRSSRSYGQVAFRRPDELVWLGRSAGSRRVCIWERNPSVPGLESLQ
jgi:hypothetical protein